MNRPLRSTSHLVFVPDLPDGTPTLHPAHITGQITYGQHMVHMAGTPAHSRSFHKALHDQFVGTLHGLTANGIDLAPV